MLKLVTVREAAKETGYSEDWIRKLVKSGRVRGERPGHEWLIHISSLERWQEKMEKLGRKKFGRRA